MSNKDFLSLFDQLTIADDKLQTLDKLISHITSTEDDKDLLCKDIQANDRLSVLRDLLCEDSSNECKTNASNLTAELAKSDVIREGFVQQDFIPPLVELLKGSETTLMIQACRALGNICYENDVGRDAVDKVDGVNNLLNLLKNYTNKTDKDAAKLRVIACGFLLNLSNTSDSIQQKALDNGAVDILCGYIKTHSADRELCQMVLATFTCLLDTDSINDEMARIKVSSCILNLMKTKDSSTHDDSSIFLLTQLAENDDVKEMLAVSDLPQRLIDIIADNSLKPRHREGEDVEGDDILTQAADMVVTLLRGDKSMQILFGHGDGVVFKECLRWLESNNDHLEIAGSLAVGNFARNDEHCMKLVDRRVVPQLIALLEDPLKRNITLQHACLSALRNLAIPVANKPVLVAAGVLSVVLKLVSVEVMPVVFKLLGVIRMLIDGQKEAALYVANDTAFMQQLVDWCGVEEHAGVKGESTRLLAWLIKNTNTHSVHGAVVKAEAVNHLVAMVTSEHVVMQTEALLSLTLMCHSVLDEASGQLKEADVVRVLCSVLRNESSIAEVIYNALALILALNKQESFRDEMLEVGIDDIVEKLKSHDDANVSKSATDVYNALTKTDNPAS